MVHVLNYNLNVSKPKFLQITATEIGATLFLDTVLLTRLHLELFYLEKLPQKSYWTKKKNDILVEYWRIGVKRTETLNIFCLSHRTSRFGYEKVIWWSLIAWQLIQNVLKRIFQLKSNSFHRISNPKLTGNSQFSHYHCRRKNPPVEKSQKWRQFRATVWCGYTKMCVDYTL